MLNEQKTIYKEYSGKIFGEGAKKKKEAKQLVAELEQKLDENKYQILQIEKEESLHKSNLERFRNSLPKERILIKLTNRFNNEITDCEDEELAIRRQIMRVLKDSKIPMTKSMLVAKSELLKEYDASHKKLKDSLTSLLVQMEKDRLLMEVDGYIIPISYNLS